MAPRRRTVRRRAPLRRKRRIIRRKAKIRYRRRPRTGNLTLLVRDTAIHGIHPSEGKTVPITVDLSSFEETAPFFSYFESYRIHWVAVKVSPLFNVTSATYPIPRYYSAPWHRTPPITVSTGTILSLDRAKSHHGCSSSYRRFVPAVLTTTNVVGDVNTHIGKLNWKPKIALEANAQSIPHHCGLYHWSIDQIKPPDPQTYRQYEMEITAKITFYNQKNFQG
uniref:Capsid protein n=1 Tax=Miniopterus bat circovirus TaxID=3141887 RepID=A0AAU7E280_9CIRC